MPIPKTTIIKSSAGRVPAVALVFGGLAALLADTTGIAGAAGKDPAQTLKDPPTEYRHSGMESNRRTTRGVMLSLGKATLIPVAISETDRHHADTSLELTVEREATSPQERYVITVSASDPAQGTIARRGNDTYMGSFSFFAPPIPGRASTFVVGVPKQLRHLLAGDQIEIELRVDPVDPRQKLKKSRIRVLDARLIH